MSGDFGWRHGYDTQDSMDKFLQALDELSEQGWRVCNQDAFRLTNGSTDLELWYDPDSGWYFDEEEA